MPTRYKFQKLADETWIQRKQVAEIHQGINKDEYAIEQDQEIQNLKLLIQELK